MAALLTRRKQAWVERRQPSIISGTVLNNPSAVEMRYYARLDSLIDAMTAQVEKSIKRFFTAPHAEEFFAMDASVSSQARILANSLTRKFTALFNTAAPSIAEQAVNGADKASASGIYESFKQLSGGLSLSVKSLSATEQEVLNASINESTALIKSIAPQYLSGVNSALQRSIAGGGGLKDLVPYLEKHKGITKRRARMIATDQTRKAYNNLNRGRMEKSGLKKFIWIHTGGSNHPRKLHQEYDGKIFSFDDLPIIDENTGEHGIPGQAINCRCRMKPIISFED